MQEIHSFLESDILKTVMSTSTKVHAIFLSYRGVEEYESGKIETGKKNLSIEVAGNFNLPRLTDFMTITIGQTIGDTTLTSSGVESMCQHAVSKQQEAIAQVNNQIESDTKILFVTYAGLSAFEESIDHCKQIREKYPDAFIIVLTCDCELKTKKSFITPFLKEKIINEFVYTSRCGGKSRMRLILEKVIKEF